MSPSSQSIKKEVREEDGSFTISAIERERTRNLERPQKIEQKKKKKKKRLTTTSFFAQISSPNGTKFELNKVTDFLLSKIPQTVKDKVETVQQMRFKDFKGIVDDFKQEQDRKRLSSVQDFFKYTEDEGARDFFATARRCF
jgi:hypothetical protein